MVVSSDQKQAIIGYYQVLARSNPSYERIELKGLHPDYEYTVMETDQTAYGDELMYAGIALTHEYPGVEAYDKNLETLYRLFTHCKRNKQRGWDITK